MTVNAQGHVGAFTTQKYKIIDTTYLLNEATTENVENENAAIATTTLKTATGADAGSSAIKIASDNNHLVVNAADNQINLGLVWGTF
jgi:hypothetical protein